MLAPAFALRGSGFVWLRSPAIAGALALRRESADLLHREAVSSVGFGRVCSSWIQIRRVRAGERPDGRPGPRLVGADRVHHVGAARSTRPTMQRSRLRDRLSTFSGRHSGGARPSRVSSAPLPSRYHRSRPSTRPTRSRRTRRAGQRSERLDTGLRGRCDKSARHEHVRLADVARSPSRARRARDRCTVGRGPVSRRSCASTRQARTRRTPILRTCVRTECRRPRVHSDRSPCTAGLRAPWAARLLVLVSWPPNSSPMSYPVIRAAA